MFIKWTPFLVATIWQNYSGGYEYNDEEAILSTLKLFHDKGIEKKTGERGKEKKEGEEGKEDKRNSEGGKDVRKAGKGKGVELEAVYMQNKCNHGDTCL